MIEKKRSGKLAVVVVTFNRSKLLSECLQGIYQQTKKIDKLFIIDNASTDNTQELINEHKSSHSNIDIETVFNKINTGGAGGFHDGIKMAHQQGFEWIWVMDDDVEPMPDALEKLMEWSGISKCIHPRKVYSDSSPCHWESIICPTTGKRINLHDSSFENKEYCFTNTACFEGMLIHSSIIDRIGYPDRRFFIVYDDTSYGLLASQYTNITYIKNAVLIKKINKENEPPTPFYLYHSVRNYKLRQAYVSKVYKPTPLINAMPYIIVIIYLYRALCRKEGKLESMKSIIKGFIHSFQKELKNPL